MGRIIKWLKVLFCIFMIAIGITGFSIISQAIEKAYIEKTAFLYLTLETISLENATEQIIKEMKEECSTSIPQELIATYTVLKSELKFELSKTQADKPLQKILHSPIINLEHLSKDIFRINTSFQDYKKIAEINAQLLVLYKNLLNQYARCVCQNNPKPEGEKK